jgi:hypothetical protein
MVVEPEAAAIVCTILETPAGLAPIPPLSTLSNSSGN